MKQITTTILFTALFLLVNNAQGQSATSTAIAGASPSPKGSGKKPSRQQAANPVVIPFELTSFNNISIKAVLNHKDTVRLMFHTAANALSLTEEAVKRLNNLVFDRADSVSSWGGGGNESRHSARNTLQIGSMAWNDVPIWENKNTGQFTDGKFGTDLFKDKVIELDFDAQQMTIYTSLPKKAKRYEKLPLRFENDMMFVEASCVVGDSTFHNRFLLHSGYAGSILFDDVFTASHQLSTKLTITDTKSLRDSFGNVLKVQKAKLPVLRIGQQSLTDVPAGFFEGAIGRQKMSALGGDVLKRFNLIIDANRTFLYLRANHQKESPWSNV